MKEVTLNKNFINFKPEKFLLRLAEVYAAQQGIKNPRITIIREGKKAK